MLLLAPGPSHQGRESILGYFLLHGVVEDFAELAHFDGHLGDDAVLGNFGFLFPVVVRLIEEQHCWAVAGGGFLAEAIERF